MGDFVILYGSQTGQAEAVAQQLKEQTEVIGLNPRLFTLNENEKKFNIETESLVVIIVSSTGDGDPPENCDRFVRRIHRKTLEQNFLAEVDYALLGLGDSNYSSYQAIPKKIDKQFQYLGANRIAPLGEADDQVGLELVVEPWLQKLYKVLCERFSISEDKLSTLFSAKLTLSPSKEKEEKEVVADSPPSVLMPEVSNILSIEPFEYEGSSIIKGDDKLSGDANLRVPIAPQSFVLSSVSHKNFEKKDKLWQNACKMVGVVSDPFDVTVVGTALLTKPGSKKPKYEITIELGEHESALPYEPGDAFYFVAPNPEKEVNYILDRMGLLSLADKELSVTVDANTKKIKSAVPPHIPPVSSLRYLLTYCLDIRRAPGRPLLRIFADAASEDSDRRRLLELCSAQGMNDFTNHIRQAGLSIVDVLAAFPSVKPPCDRMIELLPRFMARPYSVASAGTSRVRFVYSVMNFDAIDGRRYDRKGVATEWLLSLKVGDTIQIMAKEPARFRFPPPNVSIADVAKAPLLMIGPGTGVSTFISFCQYLLKLKINNPAEFPKNVERSLYFGCRNLNLDYIYREELEMYVREGILSELVVCESEGTNGRPKYVQDALKINSDKVSDFVSEDGHIFVCGDAKGMSKDVFEAFCSIIKEEMNIEEIVAKECMLECKKKDFYIEDVWS